MDKRGFELGKLATFLLIVIAIVVIVSGVIPRIGKLFGEADRPLEFIKKGAEAIDFSFLTGEQKKELAKHDPGKYIDALLNEAGEKFRDGIYRGANSALALYQKYSGICDGDVNFKDAGLSDEEFLELSKYCSDRDLVINRIEVIKEKIVGELRDEINQKIIDGDLGDVNNLINELESITGITDFIENARRALEDKLQVIRDKIEKLDLTHDKCKDEKSIVDAWICEGNSFLDRLPPDESSALNAYINSITAARRTNGEEDDVRSYFRLGIMFEKQDNKEFAYNLYEDLLVLYEDMAHTLEYLEVKRRVDGIFTNDKDFYISNIAFSKVFYDLSFHGGVDEDGGTDDFDWQTEKSGVIKHGNRVDSYAVDYPVFSTKEYEGEVVADCIEERYTFDVLWGDNKGYKKSGFEVKVSFNDVNNREVCEGVWYSEGRDFEDFELLDLHSICGVKKSNFYVAIFESRNKCDSGNNFIKFHVGMINDVPNLGRYLPQGNIEIFK